MSPVCGGQGGGECHDPQVGESGPHASSVERPSAPEAKAPGAECGGRTENQCLCCESKMSDLQPLVSTWSSWSWRTWEWKCDPLLLHPVHKHLLEKCMSAKEPPSEPSAYHSS